MRRFRRTFHRSRSGRRALWQSFVQIGTTFPVEVGALDSLDVLCFWAKWPSGSRDLTLEDPAATSVNETLLRVLSAAQLIANPGDPSPAPTTPVMWGFGLLLFDGGSNPEAYDNTTFSQGSGLPCPPHPITGAGDDWIFRVPIPVTVSGAVYTPTLDVFGTGRAKRKLPAGSGILGVMGGVDYITGTSRVMPFTWAWEGRMVFRSGSPGR